MRAQLGLPAKIVSWNVNGIRAAAKKGLLNYMGHEQADIFCLQETKATPEQLTSEADAKVLMHPLGYHSYWHSAEKLGYSGVSIFSRHEPKDIKIGIGDPQIDSEGRVLTAEYRDFTLINAYFPNSQRDHARLPFKLKFCERFWDYCNGLRELGRQLVICGDFNIAHEEIDLANPKTNMDNAGFLPEERQWMTRFLNDSYVDAFRHLNKSPGQYTWWSYRPGVRERNIGWRLDYFVLSRGLKEAISEVSHRPEVMGSDHCPVMIQLRG